MSDTPDNLSFNEYNDTSWRARVEKELRGKSYDDHLLWKSLDGFEIDAWQNTLPSPLASVPPLRTPWRIMEPIYTESAQEANKLALDALMEGAEAVWFFKGFLGAAAEVACKGIDTDVAPVFIKGGNIHDPFHKLLKHGEEVIHLPEGHVEFNGKRFRERGATVVEEVAFLLAQAIEVGEQKGFGSSIVFHTGVGNAFLTEIGKIRALRWLWKSIQAKEGISHSETTVVASNLCFNYAQNDEHTNVLRASSSTLSAVLGGAQYIMIEPWNRKWKPDDGFSRRISRNIQILQKEEGRLDKNLNPADGSYFIEHLTTVIAHSAWTKVQAILAAGGFSKYAQSGALKSDLLSSSATLIQAFHEGDQTLLGVSKYRPGDATPEAQIESSEYVLLPPVISLAHELQNQSS
ncbi:MAG: methylmalonyl-CoA mutase family protein [Cryomorphaceae bacterium]